MVDIQPPNIVLINCDDLGHGDLGCYGSTVHDTPAIDRLAADGARFDDLCMASPVCSPSRAAMLTGCHPLRVGFGGPSTYGLGGVLFPGWDVGLHPQEITFARLLQQAGYATLMVGKWHCGDQPDFLPTNHGFDEWFGLPYSNDMGRQVDPPEGPTHAQIGDALAELGVDAPWITPPLPLMEGAEVVEAQPDQSTLTDRYVDRCLRFLLDHREGPFLLYLAHLYVHVPLYVPDRFLASSRNGAYGAAVAAIDAATGAIVDELERLGIGDRTLVIFTSDNGALSNRRGGGGSNGALRGSKGTTWEGGMRVPCVMRWPGRIAPGTVVDTPVTGMDLFPTIAAQAGVALPDDRVIDGCDLGGLLGISPSEPHPDRPFFYARDGAIEAVRIGRWKLHVRKQDRELCELYDLDRDVGERHDVAGEQPEVVSRLMIALDAGRAELGDTATGTVGAGVRPIGRVADPRPLTTFDPSYPYFAAEYDLPHRG